MFDTAFTKSRSECHRLSRRPRSRGRVMWTARVRARPGARYTEIVRPRLPRLRIVSGILAAIVFFATYRQHVPGADLELEGMLLPTHPSRPWVLVQGKYWQIEATETEDPNATDSAEGTRGACPVG